MTNELKTRSYEAVKADYDHMIERHRKSSAQRMENYYNCLDDYSWGGLCDQAQNEAEMKMRGLLAIMKDQREKGYRDVTDTIYALAYLDGEIIENARITRTRFGEAWIIVHPEDGSATFVNSAKQLKTYHKKGFTIMKRKVTTRAVATGYLSRKGNPIMTAEVIKRGRWTELKSLDGHCLDRRPSLEYFYATKL